MNPYHNCFFLTLPDVEIYTESFLIIDYFELLPGDSQDLNLNHPEPFTKLIYKCMTEQPEDKGTCQNNYSVIYIIIYKPISHYARINSVVVKFPVGFGLCFIDR